MKFPGQKQVDQKVIQPVKQAVTLAITAIVLAITAIIMALAAI
jgi:hypothetical protein